jgi:hypothetical protein
MFEGSKIHGSQPIGKTPVALEVFREVNRTFPGTAEIRRWHSNGKKIFGWLCTYVPEEILLLAGYCLFGLPDMIVKPSWMRAMPIYTIITVRFHAVVCKWA